MANRTPTRTTTMILALTLAGPTLVATARAETVELVDKTKLNAKVVHYYDGVYTLDTNGQTIKVPKEKIKAITFQLPPARAEFSTPEKTFERWRKALAEGATERAVDCYALVDQGMMAAQMGLGQMSDGINKMRKEIEGTKFQVKGSKIKGDTATLTVLRQKGDESDTGEVAFVRENGEWKLFMPMNDPAAR